MKFKAYPRYKDSEVEWLGEVPEHWKIKKLKYLCKVQTGDKDTVNAIDDGKYPFFVRSQIVERINSYTSDCEAVLTAGDGAGVGKVFHYINGKFDFHQRVYAMYNFHGVLGSYFFYYLREMFYKVALDGSAKSTVDSLRLPIILNFPITISDITEQATIINFLDRETSRIDALIEEKNRFIELLKEKRHALISHAVTKGLDPTVKMKDSGVEWLGEAPEHWVICQLKYKLSTITDGAHVSPETDNGLFPFVSTVDLKSGSIDFENCLKTSGNSYHILKAQGCQPILGDVLFSKDGTIGKTVIVDNNYEFVVASSLVILRPKKIALIANYLNYVLQSNLFVKQIDSSVRGSALKRVSLINFKKIYYSFPSINEQTAIANFLDSETTKIDALLQETKVSIELLKEHRTALISAAVTGKIDVREAA